MSSYITLTTNYFEYKTPSNLRRIQFLNDHFKKKLYKGKKK
jgi:hypothetical protein